MSLDKNRIKELLGNGLSNEIVATTVGCDSSYITQLMSDNEFREEVIQLRAAALTANTKRDKNIDGIEDKLIEILEELVDTRMFMKPREVLSAFAVLNNAKRRGVPAHESLVINQKIVNLTLPTVVVEHFTITPQGEVIDVEVEGRKQTLQTMPTSQLLRTLASKGGQNGSDYEKVSRYLPSTALASPAKTAGGE